jgi:hypothetical protein
VTRVGVAAPADRVKPARLGGWLSVGVGGRLDPARRRAADRAVRIRRSRMGHEQGPIWIVGASVIGGGFV